jgi:TPR repeat protein
MNLSWYRWVGLIAALQLFSFFAHAQPAPEKLTADQLLLRGNYERIAKGENPHDRAIWAYARLQMAPTKEAYDIAWEAHQKGEPMGTFVILLCHREGRAVRRDEKAMHELNHALRNSLVEKKEPTPVELYILSNTNPADANGIIDSTKIDTKADDKQRREWLQQSADKGFAQAQFDLGKELQLDDHLEKAHAMFDKAAESGLAAAWRTKGFCLIEGIGVPKDAAKGFATTVEAANRGDAFAMVSLSFYCDKGLGTKRDLKEAHDWIEKAAKTGHWLGYLERAQSRIQGINGYEANKEEARKDIEQALETRNRDALEALALWYTNAVGVDRDGRKAVRYGEAAFVQGSTRAARILAHVYKQGVGGIEINEDRATFWSVQSSPNAAFTLAAGLERRYADVLERLKKLDPWSVK